MTYSFEKIISNPRIACSGPLNDISCIVEAEKEIGIFFPPLLKKCIEDFGFLRIKKKNEDFLVLTGTPDTGLFEDIVLFNPPDNPTRPDDFLVFAWGNENKNDFACALNPEGRVFMTYNSYLFPFVKNKKRKNADWKISHSSLEEFWQDTVQRFLDD
ncbi:MAG: hypothetical protein OEZ34_05360 [Spirochaetia bacterium]|nr:hypothetical protein [Spirochaetia bacterium]